MAVRPASTAVPPKTASALFLRRRLARRCTRLGGLLGGGDFCRGGFRRRLARGARRRRFGGLGLGRAGSRQRLPRRGLALALGEKRHRLVERDRIGRRRLRDRRVHLPPIDVSAEPPVAHRHRPALGCWPRRRPATPPPSAFALSSARASSSVRLSGSFSRGMVALILP